MLQVWLPLNKEGDFQNRGLADVTVTNIGSSYNNEGKIGGCYQRVRISNNTDLINKLNKNIFSISLWIYLPNTNEAINFFQIGNNANNQQLHAGIRANKGVLFYDFYANSINYSSSGLFDKWIHLTFTHDGTKKYIYIDGNLVTSGNSIAQLQIPSNPTYLDLGISLSSGKTNDFRIYDHVLSPKEVKEISKGLVLHYPLNDIIGKNLAANTNWEKTSSSEYMQIINTFSDQGLGEYTFSCDMKVASGNPSVNIYFGDGNYTKKYNYSVSNISVNGIANGKLSQEWQRIVCKLTFTSSTPDSTIMPHISTYYTYGSGAIVSVRKPKLEKGWNPYPVYTNSTDPYIMYDCSGYQNDGTITGTLTTSEDSPRYDKCTVFKSHEWIQSSYVPKMQEEFTCSWWFTIANPSGERQGVMFSNYAGDNNSSFVEIEVISGNLRIHFSDETNNTKSWTPIVLAANKQYFLGLTYKDHTFTLYLYYDGQQHKYTQTYSDFNLIHSSRNYVNIGSMSNSINGINFNGTLSDLRVYHTALSVDDIKELYDTSAFIDNSGNLLTYQIIE